MRHTYSNRYGAYVDYSHTMIAGHSVTDRILYDEHGRTIFRQTVRIDGFPLKMVSKKTLTKVKAAISK